ncbi:MAG: response regulator [Bacilli bacterium]|nr:response regulator [Bacilli bacterium]
MYGIIISVSIIIAIIASIYAYKYFKKYKEIKRDYDILKKDNKNFVSRYLMECEIFIKLSKNIKEILDKVNTASSERELREICNNIEVTANEETPCVDDEVNVDELFEKLQNKQVIIDVDKDIPKNLILDELKLLSALKLIVKKSQDNGIKDKIKISIKMVEKINCNIKLRINIENIKLSNQNVDILNKIFKKHTIDYIDDSDILLIRTNLFCLKSNIEFKEKKKINSMFIDIPVFKQKEERLIPKALVVDDSKHTAIMHQDILKELGVDADVVFSGEECLEKIKNNMDEYDIIFTDNQMPNMCGPELFRELKSLNQFNLPVVIITGDAGEDYYFKEQCGFNEYIVKPLDKNKAKKVINKILKKKK